MTRVVADTLRIADAWLQVHEADDWTLDRYRGLADRTMGLALGGRTNLEARNRALEQFYTQLRRCSARCDGKPPIEHRIAGEDECRVVKHRWPPGRPSAKTRAEHDCDAAGCKVTE